MIFNIWPDYEEIFNVFWENAFNKDKKTNKEIMNITKSTVKILSVVEPKMVKDFIDDVSQSFFETYMDERGRNAAKEIHWKVSEYLSNIAEKYQ